jgi:hypothetical protein
MTHLLEFATLIRETGDETPINPLVVFHERENDPDTIREKQQQVKGVINKLDNKAEFHTATRIDNNITNGIVRAAEEIAATSVILGWHTRTTPFNILFGDVLNNLLEKTDRMLIVLKTPSTIRNIKRVLLFVTGDAHLEQGFNQWLEIMVFLAKNLQLKIRINSSSKTTIEAMEHYYDEKNLTKYFEFKELSIQKPKASFLKNNSTDLLVFLHARRSTASYSRHFEHFMNNCMGRFKNNNLVIVYPEQSS